MRELQPVATSEGSHFVLGGNRVLLDKCSRGKKVFTPGLREKGDVLDLGAERVKFFFRPSRFKGKKWAKKQRPWKGSLIRIGVFTPGFKGGDFTLARYFAGAGSGKLEKGSRITLLHWQRRNG